MTTTVWSPPPSGPAFASIVDARRRALVQAEEGGCGHRGRALPVLVDLLLEAREALRRNHAARPRVRRTAPDELDVDVVAAAGRDEAEHDKGGARVKSHAALVQTRVQ